MYFGIQHFLLEDFLLENTMNDFNKLISRRRRLLVILAGSPRSGKTWVYKKYIQAKVKNSISINPDDISYVFTKDPNIHKVAATRLSTSKAEKVVSDRKDDPVIVYDSTGFDVNRIKRIVDKARENRFYVIIINVFAPLKETIERNRQSSRKVDEDYLVKRWKAAQANIKILSKAIEPEEYFIVINSQDRQFWYKYENERIVK